MSIQNEIRLGDVIKINPDFEIKSTLTPQTKMVVEEVDQDGNYHAVWFDENKILI